MSGPVKTRRRPKANPLASVADDLVGNPATERKRKGGQRPHIPEQVNREHVSLWASMGLKHTTIAELLGISIETLAKYYRAELDDGGASALGKVAKGLFDKAIAGDTVSMIFYLKTRGRWRETASVGDRDNPLVIEGKAHDPKEVAIALARKLRADKAAESMH